MDAETSILSAAASSSPLDPRKVRENQIPDSLNGINPEAYLTDVIGRVGQTKKYRRSILCCRSTGDPPTLATPPIRAA
jgi:hypothetical protein